jgi:pectinesterase
MSNVYVSFVPRRLANLFALSLVACGSGGVRASADGGAPDGGGPDATTEAGYTDAVADERGDASPIGCTGTPRPQLADAEAAQNTILGYLAQAGSLAAAGGLVTDNWDPTAGVGDVATFTPTYTVAMSGGTHTSVQAAITSAVAQGGTNRVYIRVLPGTYREVVCVPSNAPPITLYGANADASQTVIAFNNYNGEAADSGAPTNPCSPPSATTNTFGTNGSATFAAFATGFEAKNITFANDVTAAMLVDPDGGPTRGTQAVALYTQADKILLDNVRVLGHQDTLYVESPSVGSVVRAYVKGSLIAGDVDFIFGGATVVFDGCEIQAVSDRRVPTTALSPSTDSRTDHGILVINSHFTSDNSTALAGKVALGRAWDRSSGSGVAGYVSNCIAAGRYPNGQAVVRDSTLDGHIAMAPWVASATTGRPFCSTSWTCLPDGGACPANRLFESQNTGAGSAH